VVHVRRPQDVLSRRKKFSVKGYIRKITGGKLGDVEGLGGEVQTYAWSARVARNNEIATGEQLQPTRSVHLI
jgi:hypothetical protein